MIFPMSKMSIYLLHLPSSVIFGTLIRVAGYGLYDWSSILGKIRELPFTITPRLGPWPTNPTGTMGLFSGDEVFQRMKLITNLYLMSSF
jgi:hypothetical protein